MKKLLEASTRSFSLWELKVILGNEFKCDKLTFMSLEWLYNSSHLFFRPIFFQRIMSISFDSLCGCPSTIRVSSFLDSFKPLSKLHRLWIKSVGFIFENLPIRKILETLVDGKSFNYRALYFRIKAIPVTLWIPQTMKLSFFLICR